MSTLTTYRTAPQEQARRDNLLALLQKNRHSVLDVGARDGYYSTLLTQYFESVTALDLVPTPIRHPRITTLVGSICALEMPNNAFDCIFCAEVLEHINDLARACKEIARLAKYEILVGVPFRQDLRVGRTTCASCKKHNPPWGHLHSFDHDRLVSLFPSFRVSSVSYVGASSDIANPVSRYLLDLAGNPWGTYDQEEPCIYCHRTITRPGRLSNLQKALAAVGLRITAIQRLCTTARPLWIHLLFSKEDNRNR
jgi:SAM-dependent methyltransferase